MLLTGYLKDKSIPIDLVCPVGLRVVVTELRIFLTATFVLVGSGKEG
jgi:hypothetical protein